MSTPQSTIHICKGVRLNNNYDHTIMFSSREAQIDYFWTKIAKTFEGYAYLRKRWSIKVSATMAEARTWSYLFFKNPDTFYTATRWAFYFITDVEYINDATVELFLEMDVMQTYLDDYTLQDCFVEREHSETDAFGENTNDEGLDTGELVPVSVTDTTDLNDLCVLILSTIDLVEYCRNKGQPRILGTTIDGIFSGLGVFAVSMTRMADFQALLKDLGEEVASNAIVSMWMYPRALIDVENANFTDGWDEGYTIKNVGGGVAPLSVLIGQPNKLAGQYTPKNTKLLQYPYSLLYATNNNGGAAVYRFEWFENDERHDALFRLDGALVADACVKLIPEGYHHTNASTMDDEGLVMSGFPTCAWNSDTFKLWLAQNQNQHNLIRTTAGLTIAAGIGTAVVGGAVTAATGGAGALLGGGGIAGGISMAASGVQQIAQLDAQIRDYELQPPAAKGVQSSSVNIVTGKQCFTLIHKTVDECHARRIDDYFTMYGYKTCRVKTPNVDSRPHFNYVKTVGSNVKPKFGICHADLSKINAVFDRGITFWKNGDEIGDYSVNNRPV